MMCPKTWYAQISVLAVVQVKPDYAPTITFMVVQKRHHTRIFPVRPQDAEKSGNVMPGESLHFYPLQLLWFACSRRASFIRLMAVCLRCHVLALCVFATQFESDMFLRHCLVV